MMYFNLPHKPPRLLATQEMQPTSHRFPETRFDFPQNFLFGCATSSHQVEGQTDKSDWWDFERFDGNVKNFAECSSQAKNFKSDHWRQFPQDIERMSDDLGVNTYRFSLDWARINPERGIFDMDVLNRYTQLAKQMRDKGIRPLVTLFHWSSPKWIWQANAPYTSGWYDPDTVLYFSDYVAKVASSLSPYVDFFCTLNEPNIFLYGGYSEGILCPGHKRNDRELLPVLRNLFHAHVTARQILKEKIPSCDVGIAHNYYLFEPYHNWNPLNRPVAAMTEHGFTWSIADAFVTGDLAFMTRDRQLYTETIAGLKDSLDFMGVNFYERALVKMDKPWRTRQPQVLHGHNEDKEVWPSEIHTQGFMRVLQTIKDRYDLPIYITENGQATPNDNQRQDFLLHHLAVVSEAIQQGIDVRGYFWWSLLDNQEWAGGFLPRLGLYEVDYDTGDRHLRTTGAAYAKVIKNQGFAWPQASLIEP